MLIRVFNRLLIKVYLRIAMLLLPCLVLFAGCACWSPQHADEPACRSLRQAVDCQEQNVLGKATELIPLVGLIGSSPLDEGQKDQMIGSLANVGVGALACAIRAIQLAAAPVASTAPGESAGPERLRASLRAHHVKAYADHYLEKNHVVFKREPRPAAMDFAETSGQ